VFISKVEPPAWFDKDHKKKFDAVVGILTKEGAFPATDYDLVCAYVENWMMARRAYSELLSAGMTIPKETATGVVYVTNPAFRQYQDCTKIIVQISDKFGFNPRARMGIKEDKTKENEVDPFADLLKDSAKNGGAAM